MYIILESREHFGTQWCPQSALSSNFFYCDEEQTLKINSEYICDGHPDCPLSKADESSLVCSREELKLMTTALSFSLYMIGFLSAAYLIVCRSSDLREQRIVKKMLANAQQSQLVKTLRLITNYLKEPNPKNEKDLIQNIEKLTDKNQLMTLIRVVHKVEIETEAKTVKMFEPTVEKIFLKKSEHTALLNFIKEDPNSSKKLKMDVLKALEPKGYLSNLGAALDEKLSPNFKTALAMVVEICLTSLGLFLIFVQETKDILTILSIHTFHQDVIQGRIHLIDNLPLMEFVAILSVIYGFTFLIKLLSAVTNAGSTPNGEAHSCHINILTIGD